jgi:hypothetical protein
MMEILEKNGKQRLSLFVFECAMAVFYLAISIVLLFTTMLDYAFYNKGLKLVVGVLFGIYAIFRVFRSLNKLRDREMFNK